MDTAAEPQETSIIDIVEEFVSALGWNFCRKAHSVLEYDRHGKWGRFDFTVALRSDQRTLAIFAQFHVHLLPGMRQAPKRFYELLNLVNQQSLLGAYSYDEDAKVVVWVYNQILPHYGEADPTDLEAVLDHALAEVDTRYLAFQYVLLPVITPQEAFDSIMPEGYALM